MQVQRVHVLLIVIGVSLTLLGGCAHPFACQDRDRMSLYERADLPPALEAAPAAMVTPPTAHMAEPATVLDPERTPCHLTLSEAIVRALENGTVGIQSIHGPGFANDDLGGFSGQGVFGADSIRVLSYQPARIGNGIEADLARFDPFFTAGMTWRTTDEPTQGLASFSNGQSATLSSSLINPLSTGGVFGVT